MNGRDASGFTLVELLVTVAILGIVMVPIGATFVVGLRASGEAQERITDSRAAQMSASFFAGDVQAAATVTAADPRPCSATTAAVVSFRWPDDRSPDNVASYVARRGSGPSQLVRLRCRGSTLVSSVPLARDLAAAEPTVACAPSCSAPRSVTMTVRERSGFTLAVWGTRRTT